MTDTTGPISISLSYDAGSDLNVCNLDIRVRLPPETRIEWLAHSL